MNVENYTRSRVSTPLPSSSCQCGLCNDVFSACRLRSRSSSCDPSFQTTTSDWVTLQAGHELGRISIGINSKSSKRMSKDRLDDYWQAIDLSEPDRPGRWPFLPTWVQGDVILQKIAGLYRSPGETDCQRQNLLTKQYEAREKLYPWSSSSSPSLFTDSENNSLYNPSPAMQQIQNTQDQDFSLQTPQTPFSNLDQNAELSSNFMIHESTLKLASRVGCSRPAGGVSLEASRHRHTSSRNKEHPCHSEDTRAKGIESMKNSNPLLNSICVRDLSAPMLASISHDHSRSIPNRTFQPRRSKRISELEVKMFAGDKKSSPLGPFHSRKISKISKKIPKRNLSATINAKQQTRARFNLQNFTQHNSSLITKTRSGRQTKRPERLGFDLIR